MSTGVNIIADCWQTCEFRDIDRSKTIHGLNTLPVSVELGYCSTFIDIILKIEIIQGIIKNIFTYGGSFKLRNLGMRQWFEYSILSLTLGTC